jgi:hypothetical protein
LILNQIKKDRGLEANIRHGAISRSVRVSA